LFAQYPDAITAVTMALAVRGAGPLKPEIRLAQALSEYEAILSDTEKATFRTLRSGQTPAVSDVMKLTAEIDRNNSLRRSRRCFGPRFTNILEAIQQFSTIVDVIIGGSQSLIASAIWGTLKMTLQITSGFASYFDNLSALFMKIGCSSPRYQEYGILYPRSHRLQRALCEYFCAIVGLCRKAVLFIRRPLVAQLSSAILKPFQTEFGPLEAELIRLAKAIREEASLASKQELSIESREASAFRKFLSTKASQEVEEARKLKGQTSKLRFLSACSNYDHQTSWKRARKAGTSSWMFDEPAYKQWLQEPTSNMLWCTGKLGSGKTVSTASLVQETIIRFPQALISYFFCSHDDAESLKARTVIGSLIRQLLSLLDPKVFDTIDPEDLDTLDEEATTTYLLNLLPREGRQCFVVIDGLDECHETELGRLLESLHKLLHSDQCFHIFCSSRPDMDLRYRAILQPQLKMSLPHENPEIAQYIDSALADRLEAGNLCLGDPTIILAIRDALLKGSQGML